MLSEWVFKPLQSLAILSDPEVSGLSYEEMMELVENPDLAQTGLAFDLSRYQSNLNLMKREVFSRFIDFDSSNNGDGEWSILSINNVNNSYQSLL